MALEMDKQNSTNQSNIEKEYIYFGRIHFRVEDCMHVTAWT